MRIRPFPTLLVVGVLVLLPERPCAAQNGAPTESEMREAIEARFDIMNDNMRTTQERCQRREFEGDPVMAMQCLALFSADGGRGDLTFEITGFEKVACEKAAGQPGYVCDYIAGIRSNSPFMRGAMGEMLGAGSMGQARFVRTERGWLFIPNSDG